jgi:hypothetical protein
LVLHPFHRQKTPVNWHSGPNKHKNQQAVDINMAFRQNIVLYSLMLFIILLLSHPSHSNSYVWLCVFATWQRKQPLQEFACRNSIAGFRRCPYLGF